MSIFSNLLGWKYSLRLLLELANADEANPKLATVKVMARAREVWRFIALSPAVANSWSWFDSVFCLPLRLTLLIVAGII